MRKMCRASACREELAHCARSPAHQRRFGAFAVGDRVSHPQFGGGTVTAIEGPKLSIAFDTRGEKQIVDSYVKRLKKS